MASPKEEVAQLVERLPDDVSYDEIQYRIYVREKVNRGLRDVEEGRVVTQDEAKQRFSQWIGK